MHGFHDIREDTRIFTETSSLSKQIQNLENRVKNYATF